MGRGTATLDGVALAHATLAHLSRMPRVLAIFTTHYAEVCDLAHQLAPIAALSHMEVAELAAARTESEEAEVGVEMVFRVATGCAQGSFAFKAARAAGLPSNLLREAHRAAASRRSEALLSAGEAKLALLAREALQVDEASSGLLGKVRALCGRATRLTVPEAPCVEVDGRAV